MSYKEHAIQEFKAAGWMDEKGNFNCEMQELICNQVLELLGLFSKHGHSGTTAPYAINLFKNLASFTPVIPLTGKDDEWVEISEGVFQNKRCSHVFKEKGKAYDIQGKVFREPDGNCYTSSKSRVFVEFPYTPKTEYVDVKDEN